MKLASMKFFAAVAAAVLVFAGCTKKPVRPDPSMTTMGLTPGGADINTKPESTTIPSVNPDLALRGEGFGPDGQNRTALQAQTVYFDYNESVIKAGERAKLQAAKAYLSQHPTHKLLLEGHCDWRGTAEYNLSLGDRRAAAVKKYLQSIGVAPDRMDTLSKGSLEAMKNADAATMEKDRRVDLVVIDPGAVPAKTL